MMQTIRDGVQARSLGLPTRRFAFECACGKGTQGVSEYVEHVTACPNILPAVRDLVIKQAGRAAKRASRAQDRDGQLSL